MTFAARKALADGAVFLDVDTCMVRLYGADTRPAAGVMEWYLERRDRCRGLLWDMALDVMRCGTDVYLELGLVTADEREAYYAKADLDDLRLVVHLLDAPRDVRRARVAARNQAPKPHTQVVPGELFERASDAWQAPSERERAARRIVTPG